MSIVIETRLGGRSTEEHLPLGDRELTAAIAKLDGQQTTALTITVGGSLLLVGGGAGRYVVTAWVADGQPCELVGNSQATGEIPMVVGGQLSPQPGRYIVAGDLLLKVTRYFSKTGHMDDEEVWEEP
jgi:hypothetical protein